MSEEVAVVEKQAVVSPVRIFYSYAHADEVLRIELEKHVSGLRRENLIIEWHDRLITAGADWEDAIDTHLDTASLILLLVSPDFLASDYCYGIEMQRALERHARGEAVVIPIILRPVDWQTAPFAHLQCLPRNGKPVTTWENRDEAFLDVAKGIRTAINHLLAPEAEVVPPASPPSEAVVRTAPKPGGRALALPRTMTAALPRTISVTLPLLTRREGHRQLLLKEVHAFWIAGVLEQSLHGAALIALGLHERPDIIANPWGLVLQQPERAVRTLPRGTQITQVYDAVGGELLILGSPGSGKTTLLLELTRALLARARLHGAYPVPVVFNLSSWAARRQTLAHWLIDELHSRYRIPRNLSRAWVHTDQVILLLDGLDEVPSEYRADCVEAINAFRQEHGLAPMVVCSRRDEYLDQQARIQLRSAVSIQPLTPQQIDRYLSGAEGQLEAVRVALQHDPVLQELACSPLMLSVLTLAYHGLPVETLVGSLEMRRRQVFATYVQRMFERRGPATKYTAEQTVRLLAWIARQLVEHNQIEFSIEQIKPDWLPDKRTHQLYQRVIVRLLSGLLLALFLIVGAVVIFKMQSEMVLWMLVELLLGMICGVSCAMLSGQWSGKMGIWRLARTNMLRGLLSGFLGGLLNGLLGWFLIRGPFIEWLFAGSVIGGIIGGITGWLAGEGFACIQHILLRLLLRRTGYLPWNYAHFLDYAVSRILLRKIGDNYIFIHRLLLDYFASLDTSSPADEDEV